MDLNQLTITEAKKGLKEKKFSSVELVKDCLERIKKVEQKIKAFVTINEEEALNKAKECDDRDLPLGGIPLAIKDNFCTQGIRTTASSLVLDNFIPQYEATVVKKLKEAGAIILGKTNMDAWAHGSSTETSQYFTTRNPWNINRLPGGSSGGSAAAVAADMTLGSIGSETAGSIRQPAAWCGVVGFKPSYGVVSRYGLIAMASSLDCPGPMTKSVADAELIFSLLKGKDFLDATSVDLPAAHSPLSKIRIGIAASYFPKEMDQEIKTIVRQAIDLFRRLGFEIKEISLLDPHFAIADYTVLQRSEVSSNLGRYDGIRYGNDRTSFGAEAKRRIMLGTYTLSSGYYEAYYLQAEKVRTLICQDFTKAFREVDIIILPTTPCPALPIGATEKSSMFGEMQDILVEASSMAGLPGISLPCGFTKENLPVGLQIIGPRFSEELILSMAQKYEEETEWHERKPVVS